MTTDDNGNIDYNNVDWDALDAIYAVAYNECALSKSDWARDVNDALPPVD